METTALRDVKNIQDSHRRCLEDLLGGQLQSDQQVFIMAFTPGVIPDVATRRAAFQRINQTLDQAQRRARQQGITDEQADVAVDEVMQQVRRRSP